NVNKIAQLAIATTLGFVVSLITLFFIYDVKGDSVKARVKKTLRNTNKPALIRIKDSFTSLFAKKPVKKSSKKPTAKTKQSVISVEATATKRKAAAKKAPVPSPAKKKPT